MQITRCSFGMLLTGLQTVRHARIITARCGVQCLWQTKYAARQRCGVQDSAERSGQALSSVLRRMKRPQRRTASRQQAAPISEITPHTIIVVLQP